MYVLFAAGRLKIFTLLATKGMTVAELAERLDARTQLLPALLDACAAMELLRVKDGLYENSHVSDAYLVEGKPLYMGDLIELQANDAAQWQGLYDAILGRREVAKATVQTELDPRGFTLAMNNLAMLGEAEALAAAVDLSGCRTMADIGCGSGIYSVTLCRHYPDLHAVLLDRKETLETTREIVRWHNLQDRIDTRPADITQDAYGQNLDVVLLSDVLYQDEAISKTILRSAYGALAVGGRLVVRGYYSDPEGSQPLFGALFSVMLLLSDPNREPITLPGVQAWIEETRFKSVKTFALTERSTCLIAAK
jgi:predicted nicotinamide N-methyase